MHIGQAFDLVSRYDSLRKRRLSLEMMVWCIVGMALPPSSDSKSSGQPSSGRIPELMPDLES